LRAARLQEVRTAMLGAQSKEKELGKMDLPTLLKMRPDE
jgi:hypothetical protein